MAFRGGWWFEQANRTVESQFFANLNGDPNQAGVHTGRTLVGGLDAATFDTSRPGTFYGPNARVAGAFTVIGDDEVEMGRRLWAGTSLADRLADEQAGESRTRREIRAWNLEMKTTLLEDLDIVAGLRLEDIRITSVNNPYNGFCGTDRFVDGDCPDRDVPPTVFPNRTLFLDRLDNPADPPIGDGVTPPPGFTFNDELIGFRDPLPPGEFVDCRTRDCLDEALRGEIDEFYVLPSVSSAYRPWEGWVFRFAYSQTVARPSFREISYYASLESQTDDVFVGNPALTNSEVESFDARVEWTFGDFGDLVAASVFYKTIEDPIEQVVIIDTGNVDCTGVCVFRTFLNNPDDAELLGVELEARKTLDFIGSEALGGFLETFSVGGNFTYIDAEVERSDIQRERSQRFYGLSPADDAAGLGAFSRMSKKRRLFGQPEWIANADISFDHPDWGTKATLSIFAISEVLDAIGTNELTTARGVIGMEFDRYVDKFYQLDFVVSQTFEIPGLPGEFSARASVKNLTDTTRKIIYDQSQTIDDIAERSFKIGRDYSFALGYTFAY